MDIISYKFGKEKGGVQPTGEIEITQNGITNVSGYATANVQVPQPSGKITITENGTDIDVSSYASADVSVGGDLVAPTQINFLNQTMETFTAKKDIDFTNLQSIPIFQSCTNMTTINLNAWKTTKSMDWGYAFFGCSSLTTIDFGTWDVVNVSGVYGTFTNCSNLEYLDLSCFYNNGIRIIAQTFFGCSKLKRLDISNFDFTSVVSENNAFTGVPTDCLIYVKDQTAKDWFTTHLPSYTNVQIKS